MSKFRFSIVTLLLLLMFVAVVSAQEDCPAFVQQTLDSVTDVCSETGRDQACYGSTSIEASGRSSDLEFSQPGDLADVASIETLRLASLNLTDDIWGIALLQVRANIADSVSENATILLFGDVVLANVGRSTVDIPATADDDTDVFLRPEDSDVVTTIDSGDTVIADARLEDSSWIRLRLPDGGYGWVEDGALELDGDVEDLIVIEPDQPFYGPMQAFYVETGADQPPCTQAPPSGILIQTPEGVGEINLLINEVDIRLGSTAFIQQAAGTMIFCILEGQGEVSYNGETRTIPEGGYTTVSIENLRPSGDLSPLAGYGPAAGLATLPTDLLPRDIEIAEGLTEAQIRQINATGELPEEGSDSGAQPAGSDILPLEGTWDVTGTRGVCHNLDANYISSTGDLIFGRGTLTLDDDSFTFTTPVGTSTHTLGSDGLWGLSMDAPDTPGAADSYETTVNSPTSMTTIIHHESSTTTCETIDGTATWTYVGP